MGITPKTRDQITPNSLDNELNHIYFVRTKHQNCATVNQSKKHPEPIVTSNRPFHVDQMHQRPATGNKSKTQRPNHSKLTGRRIEPHRFRVD